MKKGNVDLYTYAMVRKVTTNEKGEATGISYISKVDMQEYKLKARVVVLGASACESARIMMNSKSHSTPMEFPTAVAPWVGTCMTLPVPAGQL
jgi:choline dehydrogenase-like flavoprotein